MVSFLTNSMYSMDYQIITMVNGAHTPGLDQFFWATTHVWPWLPMFVLMFGLIFLCYRRRSWRVILFIALAVGTSDIISSGILKPLVHRPRPSHNPELVLHLHERPNGTYYRGGPYGFPSSHAANSSTLAILLYLFLRPFLSRKWPLALLLTGFVLLFCYTRVYLGVHYPTDILGGWCVGIIVSLSAFTLYRHLDKKRQNVTLYRQERLFHFNINLFKNPKLLMLC